MKWLATAAGLVAVIFGAVEIMSISLEGPLNTVPRWLQVLQDVALLSFCVIPISIGFAVLRYRLYEIDVIIRRTLVYTVLAAVLIGVYLAGVTILSAALQAITGQSGTLAVTISTLAVAAVFQPLRRRIQHTVDHRLYRPKYDAAQTLQLFSGTLRDQIELDTLSAGVLDVVNATLQPRSASLWLQPQAKTQSPNRDQSPRAPWGREPATASPTMPGVASGDRFGSAARATWTRIPGAFSARRAASSATAAWPLSRSASERADRGGVYVSTQTPAVASIRRGGRVPQGALP